MTLLSLSAWKRHGVTPSKCAAKSPTGIIPAVDDLKLLQSLCAVPTAPFAESAVVKFVIGRVRKRSGLTLRTDRAGNLLIERAGTKNLPRTVMVAHLDHPGFVARQMINSRTLKASFYGYVRPEYFPGAKVRFFDDQGATTATVESFTTADNGRADTAVLRVRRTIAPGSVGMWDLGEPRVAGKKFHGRVCDDLAGAAAGLAVMEGLSRKRLKAPIALLLTRAEESGFIGAIASVKNKQLLKKTDRIISIECSAEQPYAKQADGMILRTGDRTSIFNSAFTRFLGTRAEALAKADKAFKFQRALMPGGTCEATVFDAFGYTAAAVCIPLGNYHNMNADTKKLAAEYVDLRDWQSLVTLLTDVCTNGHAFSGNHAELQQRLNDLHDKFAGLLRS